MDQVATYFDMGGYGLFIWPCFAVSAFVLLVLYLSSRRRLTIVEKELATLERRRQKQSGRNISSSTEESLS
ncbi:heme exporter protein CcmD [Sneathiella sp. CAU 1612]|uniref:Heme exporter protein D n=1 Tax=Sneathiella sedimenti TaxID=2816034 RepID=A0ABS3F1S0_9PROT|nr:heme exporter protein CcmD [Sneathiella sedimenti]MBO0332460.1 heme exporter protein CcmD [Sneathiella sedimenti]